MRINLLLWFYPGRRSPMFAITLYSGLRDHDSAKNFLGNSIVSYTETVKPDNLDRSNAYASLPMFRKWLVETIQSLDLLNHQGCSLDLR